MKMLTSRQRVIHIFLFLAACWLVPCCGTSLAAEPLVWKFTVGNEYHYQMVQEMEMSMDLGPTGITTTSFTRTMDMSWKVEAIGENGAATVTQHISRIQMDVTAPGQGKVHYDTASDKAPQGFDAMLAPMLTALTSEKFTVTMLPTGEITNVEIPKAFIEAMSRGPGAAMMGGFATEEGFKNMAKQGSLTLPKEEDLVAGHEWSTSTGIANPVTGKVSIDTTYRYTGPREIDGEQFEVFSPIFHTNFEASAGAAAANVEVIKEEVSGEVLFNRTAGRLESSKLELKMENVITAVGNEINQTIDQKITFKIVEPSEESK